MKRIFLMLMMSALSLTAQNLLFPVVGRVIHGSFKNGFSEGPVVIVTRDGRVFRADKAMIVEKHKSIRMIGNPVVIKDGSVTESKDNEAQVIIKEKEVLLSNHKWEVSKL